MDGLPTVHTARRQDDPSKQAAHLASILGHVDMLAFALAAPRVFAQIPQETWTEWREHAIDAIDGLIAFSTGADPQWIDMVQRMRTLVERWGFAGLPPPELVQVSREFHERLYQTSSGSAEPPGGWDAFELPDDVLQQIQPSKPTRTP